MTDSEFNTQLKVIRDTVNLIILKGDFSLTVNIKNAWETLRAAGHILTLDGEKLTFKARPGAGASEKNVLLAALRQRKQEVIAYLVSEERFDRDSERNLITQDKNIAPCGSKYCNMCYEVAPGIKIHPPRPGMSYENVSKASISKT